MLFVRKMNAREILKVKRIRTIKRGREKTKKSNLDKVLETAENKVREEMVRM